MEDSSPLFLAAMFCHLGMVQVLLEFRARADHRDAHGRSALDKARELQEPRCIQLLEQAEELDGNKKRQKLSQEQCEIGAQPRDLRAKNDG